MQLLEEVPRNPENVIPDVPNKTVSINNEESSNLKKSDSNIEVQSNLKKVNDPSGRNVLIAGILLGKHFLVSTDLLKMF